MNKNQNQGINNPRQEKPAGDKIQDNQKKQQQQQQQQNDKKHQQAGERKDGLSSNQQGGVK